MRNYAQMIREATYTGYDPEYNVDYLDDAYMAELDDKVWDDKMRQMCKSAKEFAVMQLWEDLERQGYTKKIDSEFLATWIMKKADGQEMKVMVMTTLDDDLLDPVLDFRLIIDPIYVTITDSEEVKESWRTIIKVSTKDSKAKPVFRLKWDQRDFMDRLIDKKYHWMRVVCDPETGKAIELTEYTDPCHQLKKGELETVWYEPGYEPEQETARLPDLFYEVMEKKEMQNQLASLQTVTRYGRVTSVDGYLLVTLFEEGEPEDRSDLECEIPHRMYIKCTEDVPVMQGKVVQVVLMECFHLADGAVLWLQIPEIRTEKNGAGLMPAGGFVYV